MNNPIRYNDPTGHWTCDDEDKNGKCINYEQNLFRKINKNYSKDDAKILRRLLQSKNTDAEEAVDYLVSHNITIEHVEKGSLGEGVGAAWWYKAHPTEFHTLWIDNSELEKDYNYGLSLVLHETIHMKQGPEFALSVLGEQEAWQKGFIFYKDLAGHYPGNQQIAEKIVNLPYNDNPENLEEARNLMLQFNPEYQADLLPRYPISWYTLGYY